MALVFQVLMVVCLLVAKTSQFPITDVFNENEIGDMFADVVRELRLSSVRKQDRGTLVRLAFVDCVGATGTGKCNGCVNLLLGGNGLADIIAAVENAYASIVTDPKRMNLADFMHFTASVAVCLATRHNRANRCPLFIAGDANLFQMGREYDPTCNVQNSFPSGNFDWDDTRNFFSGQFGFNEQDSVIILVGGHSLGRCHVGNLGNHGPWPGNPNTMDGTDYAQGLLNAAGLGRGRAWRQFPVDGSDKFQWQPRAGNNNAMNLNADVSMNLNADVSLVKDIDVNPAGVSGCGSGNNRLDNCPNNAPIKAMVEGVVNDGREAFAASFYPRWNRMINHGIVP